jgi:hypothetical protein
MRLTSLKVQALVVQDVQAEQRDVELVQIEVSVVVQIEEVAGEV